MGSSGLQLENSLSEEEIAALIHARLAADEGPVLSESEIHGQLVDETGAPRISTNRVAP